MDKAFFKRILIVIMGFCAVILLFSFVSLIIEAVGYGDLLEHSNITYSVMQFTRWTAVATVCLLVPLFASYIFSCISKNTIFSISSALLSLLTAICAISFISVLRTNIMNAEWDGKDYEFLTAYMQEMIMVIVPCIVGFIFYTVNSLKAFRKTPVKANNSEVR